MKKATKKISKQMNTTLDGMMSFGTTDEGLNLLDFLSTEYAELEPFTAKCKVQAMRSGDVYITELPKRTKNTPIFREDNSTLTLGHDGKYYFVFMLPKAQVDRLPKKLMTQAISIASKVSRGILKKDGLNGLVEKKMTKK